MQAPQAPHPTDRVTPDASSAETIDLVRNTSALLYDLLAAKLPEGRYKSLALTGLEIALMWATKAITHTPR